MVWDTSHHQDDIRSFRFGNFEFTFTFHKGILGGGASAPAKNYCVYIIVYI